MIFSCDKSTLLNAINTVAKALPQKSVMPVLDGIHFRAEASEIILTCTDLSITIQTKIAATVEQEGELVLSGKLFPEIIRKMPEGIIEIKGSFAEGVNIKGSFAKMNILSLDPSEYPSLPVVDKEKSFSIPQNLLKSMISQTIFASAVDESRPILTGCLFEIEENTINVVALDGFRLALRNSFLSDDFGKLSAIIPTRALSEITKIISDNDENVTIYIQKSFCMIELEQTKIISRLIEGEFIKYRQIIPKQRDNEITVSRLDLLESIDRAWLIVRESSRNNHIVLRFENSTLIITSRSDTGNAYEEVNFSGNAQPIEIGFNPRYFVDCLKNIDDEFIKFSFTSATSPTVIRPVEGEKFLYLIVPVR